MPSEAIALVREAAQRGEPAAMAFTAVLAAQGLEEPQSWSAAFERLAQAAEAGSALARNQLRVLTGQGQARSDWARVAASFDLAAWLAPPQPEPLHENGRIHQIKALIPPALCWWLAQRAKPTLSRAKVYSDTGIAEAEVRTNRAFEFSANDLDLVIVLVQARIAAAMDIAGAILEPLQVLHYAPGQTFRPHFDFLHAHLPGHAEDLARNGQRIVTVLIYLNDNYEGGETDFPNLGVRYRGGAGDALTFANLSEKGAPDRRMLHAGLPPTRGEKWLATQWMRRPPT